jgi:hypothetical protein
LSDDDNIGLRKRIETELGVYFGSSSFRASEKLLAENPWLASSIDHAYRAFQRFVDRGLHAHPI